MIVLGIDVGGTGIKGAPVDVESGALVAERCRIPTPEPSTPDAVARAVGEIARHFRWTGLLGCTLPMQIRRGVVRDVGNLDPGWLGLQPARFLQDRVGLPLAVLNDADAAGLGEMHFGAASGQRGVVLVLTFGTGIGSALFVNGVLVPNSGFGGVRVRGKRAGDYASARARAEQDLSWKRWARRVNRVLACIEGLLQPDLFVIGGGASNDYDKFLPQLRADAPIAAARLRNDAGIVGAALLAWLTLADGDRANGDALARERAAALAAASGDPALAPPAQGG